MYKERREPPKSHHTYGKLVFGSTETCVGINIQPIFIAGTLYSHDHEPNGNGLTYIMCHFHQFGGSSGSSCQDARTGFLQNGCCRACSCRAPVAISPIKPNACVLYPTMFLFPSGNLGSYWIPLPASSNQSCCVFFFFWGGTLLLLLLLFFFCFFSS